MQNLENESRKSLKKNIKELRFSTEIKSTVVTQKHYQIMFNRKGKNKNLFLLVMGKRLYVMDNVVRKDQMCIFCLFENVETMYVQGKELKKALFLHPSSNERDLDMKVAMIGNGNEIQILSILESTVTQLLVGHTAPVTSICYCDTSDEIQMLHNYSPKIDQEYSKGYLQMVLDRQESLVRKLELEIEDLEKNLNVNKKKKTKKNQVISYNSKLKKIEEQKALLEMHKQFEIKNPFDYLQDESETKKLDSTPTQHSHQLRDVLVSIAEDHYIRFWDLNKGRCIAYVKTPNKELTATCWVFKKEKLPNNTMNMNTNMDQNENQSKQRSTQNCQPNYSLATGTRGGELFLCDPKTMESEKIGEFDSPIQDLIWNEKYNFLLVKDLHSVYFFDIETKSTLLQKSLSTKSPVDFSPCFNFISLIKNEKYIYIYQLVELNPGSERSFTLKIVRQLEDEEIKEIDPIRTCAFGNDNNHFIIGTVRKFFRFSNQIKKKKYK
ncbi:tho complex subunit 3 tho3 [Anaeramoeba flamelloides]|uniref:Tho complex subunit 3 tho3 n=1 Tax=Anaeramoeba flamelloides TaxID=1746091 RepID=A0ABQ8YR48_9EUKA|nr:tho complex subunit 3 tho3 [Anaeramoeba flamelloides]